MFADSFFEPSWDTRSRRAYSTLVSFAVEIVAAGGLLLAPLFGVHGLPAIQAVSGILVVPPRPSSPPLMPSQAFHPHGNLNALGQMIQPPSIPDRILSLDDHGRPPLPADLNQLGVDGGTGYRFAENSVWKSVEGLGVAGPPSPQPTAPAPRLSQLMEGNLVYRVQPEYPPLARQARIQGRVVLQAVVSREGRIENLQVLSGPPMLVQAAIAAVRQWRYQPCYLNGEPVEVETQVTVNFTLGGP